MRDPLGARLGTSQCVSLEQWIGRRDHNEKASGLSSDPLNTAGTTAETTFWGTQGFMPCKS